MPALAAFTQQPAAAWAPRRQWRRTSARCIAAQAAQQQQPEQAAPCFRRRRAVASGLLLLPALALQLRGGTAHADETGTAAAVTEAAPAPQEQQQPVAAEAPWRNYIAREFSFSYPPSIKEEQEDLFATVAPVVRSTLDNPVENPVKAKLQSDDRTQVVSVVVRQASNIKPTLFQLSDISQWGSPRDVAKLLLPPGAAVASYTTTTLPQPPKEGPFGPIERDPVNLYRYRVLLPDQTQVAMSVGAQKGQVYVFGAATLRSQWDALGASLEKAADSFRLIKS